MADKTLTELTDVGTLSGTQLLYIVDDDGNSRQVTLADLKTFINTDPSIVPSSEPFRGALVYRSSVLSIANASTTVTTWNAEDYDTDSIWSAGAPTRLTVPTGVTKVRLVTQAFLPNATYTSVVLAILKNGGANSLTVPGLGTTRLVPGAEIIRLQCSSAVITVTAGDYFESQIFQTSGAARDLQINSWFSMEIIEATP